MDESNEFDRFYTEKIAPSLQRLRRECKQADSWKLAGVIAAFLFFGTFLGYHAHFFDSDGATFLFVLFGAIVITAIYQYAIYKDSFTNDYKAVVIGEIIQYVNPGLVYKPGKMVNSLEYKASSLYRYKHDYYSGDDFIEGVIDTVSFHCSELHTQCVESGRNNQFTVFKGLFITAAIGSRFAGGTYLWPKENAQLAASVMDEYYRLQPMQHVRVVKTGEAAFDRYFRICTSAPGEAAEILSAERRNNILEICGDLQIPVSISFVAGRCFIGIPINEDLLEPGVYDPGDKEELRKYFMTVGVIATIIKKLGLVGLG